MIFVVGFYGLYLSSVLDAVVGSHFGHVAMNVHFLASGYLFYWVVIGVDPTPRPIPLLVKIAVVFGSLPLHTLLGDQKQGGGMAGVAGEISLLIVMIALLMQWRRSDERTAKRLDRVADRDDDADLAAYNAMLAEMASRDVTTSPSNSRDELPSVHVIEELDEQFLYGCGLIHHHHVVRIVDDLDPCIG